MSSKIDPAKMNRIERGSPKSLDDLPAKIQDVLKSIYQTCWTVWLFWSYALWNRAEDSDLDIWVSNYATYTNIIRKIWIYHWINIDCNELNKDYHLIIIQ